MKKQHNPSALKWIFSHTKKYLPEVLLLTATGAAGSFISTWGFPLNSKWILDIATGDREGDILYAGAMMFLLIIALAALHILEVNIEVRVSSRIDIALKNDVLKKILSRKYEKILKYHSGHLVNRLVSDVKVITDAIVEMIPDAVSLATKLAAGLILLFSVSLEFSILMIAISIGLFFFRRIFRGRVKTLHKQCQEADGNIRAYFTEALENLIVVKAFHANEKVLEKNNTLQMKFFKLKIKRNTLKILLTTLTKVCFSVTYYAALVWGAFGIVAGTITFGTLTALLQVINQVQSPLKNASNLPMSYYSSLASAERLMELEDIDGDLPVIEDAGAVIELVVDHVSFSYDNEHFPLRDFCLRINSGEIVGLKGPSGIGKTTLFKLLMGLYAPNSGEIYLRERTGEKLPVGTETRKVFGFVPQGEYVFSGTLRENILLGGGEPTPEILEICALSEFVNSLEQGLDTVIGERGLGLSGGQIQRVVIARAIASKAQILLFDEFTSALDEATEQRIMRQLKNLGKTCIIISHKNSTLQYCDTVVDVSVREAFSPGADMAPWLEDVDKVYVGADGSWTFTFADGTAVTV